eukprot:GDKH01002960.1.p2 GENE.GDKH01002960.1~~GDKH01002960.1.p2  ORF type:complete len:173 (-),score=63.91 GDKH01002960.1:487-1005(-)
MYPRGNIARCALDEETEMQDDQIALMEGFIVRAKAATYAAGGAQLLPYRLGAHELQFAEGEWAYHDSYFGGADFLGQEVVYLQRTPVWGMNYYGRLLQPERIGPDAIGQMIMRSLTRLYQENRFLGGFEHVSGDLRYTDENEGDVRAFLGVERITLAGALVYRLHYHGGLIR